MIAKKLLSCALILGLAAMFSAGVRAEDPKPAAKPADTKAPVAKPADTKTPATPTAKPAGDAKPAADAKGGEHGGMPSPEEMKMMMPGDFHAKLKPMAGKWTYVTKMRMTPDEPWSEATGKAEFRWALGGRFLIQEIKGNPGPMDAMMGGQPFEGLGTLGYDNMEKKYFSLWGDNMGTGFVESWGTCDESGKTFTFTGEADCHMTGKKETIKQITKVVNNDKFTFEMWGKGPDGKEFQSLEVTYTRSN